MAGLITTFPLYTNYIYYRYVIFMYLLGFEV